MKTLTGFYLYSDLHAIAVYETYHKESAQYIEHAEMYERFINNDKFHALFKGRIVFHRYQTGIIEIIKKIATGITCQEVNINHGSDATKRLNIPVGYIKIYTPKGEIHFNLMPEVLSNGITYQPDYNEKFNPDLRVWGASNITKVHFAEKNVKV